MFFTFRQNNSGGSFDFSRDLGHFVVVEADNAAAANARAETLGIYFDGSGDCPCCGNRWSEQWDDDEGTKTPEVCGQAPKDYMASEAMIWAEDDEAEIVIHYADGRVEKFENPNAGRRSA